MSNKTHRARSQLTEAVHIKGYPREHYNADHSPKMQYKTHQSAHGVAMHMLRKTGEILEPYQCSICGCWHLGHIPAEPLPDKIKTLDATIRNETNVLNCYRNDLQHIAKEVLALSTKIDNLETTINRHYQELKLYQTQNNTKQ